MPTSSAARWRRSRARGRHPETGRDRRDLAPGARRARGHQARSGEARRAPVVGGEDFDAYEQRGRLLVQRDGELLDLPLPALLGRHQIANAGTAVVAALELPALGIDEEAIGRGLVTARWPARMQRLVNGPLPSLLRPGSELWLDGGHNPAAGQALAQTVADLEERSSKPLHLVIGMMGLKDAAGFLVPFRGLARHIVAVPIPDAQETPYPPDRLAEVATRVGLDAEVATRSRRPCGAPTRSSRGPSAS